MINKGISIALINLTLFGYFRRFSYTKVKQIWKL